jgi:hypothetical protein
MPAANLKTPCSYGVVQDHVAALLDIVRDHSEHGFGYPRFVVREFEKFLACGLLCYGFVRVRCDTCAEERLVAFSCKTRGFCPSCTSRRMANTAANLADRILPIVPYRQWILSLPRRVRFLLARDSDLLSQTLGVFLAKLFAWQRRRARAHGIADPHAGAITFVQRFGSLLNLNCHAHAVLPDGVFAAGPDGAVQFHPLPPPWDDDVARLLGQIARAIHRPSSVTSRNAAMTSRSTCWPLNKPTPPPPCRGPTGRRHPSPPAIAPHSSTATRSTPAGEASRAILEHLGLPTQPPPRTRAPPGRRFDDT